MSPMMEDNDDPFEPVENNSFDPDLEDEDDIYKEAFCDDCGGPVNEEGDCIDPDCPSNEEA